MLHRLLLAFAITFINASLLFAQNTAGKIVGTVSAPDGAVAGASVTVTDDQTGKERSVTSNGEGAFEVPQLEFGSYSVKIAATGFKTFCMHYLCLSTKAACYDQGKYKEAPG